MIFQALFITIYMALGFASEEISCEPTAETSDRLVNTIIENENRNFIQLLECADAKGYDVVNKIGADDEQAAYPLCAALSVESNYYFNELLERGADVNIQSKYSHFTKQTPLLCAVSSEFSSSNRLKKLLELGANQNYEIYFSDSSNRMTVLYEAVLTNNFESVFILLDDLRSNKSAKPEDLEFLVSIIESRCFDDTHPRAATIDRYIAFLNDFGVEADRTKKCDN